MTNRKYANFICLNINYHANKINKLFFSQRKFCSVFHLYYSHIVEFAKL